MAIPLRRSRTLDSWRIVERLLPRGWQRKCRELGALRRARAIPDERTLLRLLLLHLADGCSLAETAARASQAGWCAVTPAAVFGRLQSAEQWLRWLAEQLWLQTRKLVAHCPRRVIAVDATTVCEAGVTGSQYRLHYAINLADLQCDFAAATDHRLGETFRRVPLRKGDIVLGDRAYGNPPGVQYAVQAGADVLVRIGSAGLPLFTRQGARFAVLARVRKLRVGKPASWRVCVHGPERVIPGRLFVVKKSARATRATVRKLRERAKRKGSVLQPTTLRAAAYVMIFSTLPAAEFSAARVLKWYRLRWQVELAFKRMKSLMSLGQLPKHATASCRAWLHGKLLVALLVERLIREAEALSPWGYPLGASKPVARVQIHAP
jgi:hypothetical protein